MSTGMPELGSKISLISKADIRYEGHLFTVDPQQCTIALAAVRSFGTEEREAEFPVAPQNQVYDYILFKGTDIKDIRVVNNVPTLPNDPAIMQLSVPPSLGKQPFQTPGFAHPVFGQMAPQMGQFAGGYSSMGAMAPGMRAPGMVNNKPSELNMPMSGPMPPPDLSSAILEPTRPNENVNDLIGGGSRCTTPASLGSRKSPTADQGTQAGGKKDDKKVVRPIQPPRNKERRDSRGEHPDHRNQNNRQQQMHHRNNQHPQQQHQQHQHNNQHPHHNQHPHQQHPHHHQQHQHQNNYHHNNQYPHQQQQIRQGGWVQRGQRGRPRGGGFRPSGTGNFNKLPGNVGGPNQQGVGKPKIKFDKEYDFEQANTEFEELCGKLAKSKLEDGKPEVVNGMTPASTTTATGTTTSTNTTADSDKKDDSGNETGAGETEQEEDADTFYDKTKSFFDNISCEAVERSKGRSQRTDWRTERKLNSETFGVASARRGGYRGRGGFRGMGFRGGYRGGYRNNQHGQQGGPRNNQQIHQQQNRTNNEVAPIVNNAPTPVPAAAGK